MQPSESPCRSGGLDVVTQEESGDLNSSFRRLSALWGLQLPMSRSQIYNWEAMVFGHVWQCLAWI